MWPKCLWPKIGQRHFGARASHGHNLAIFHQILTNEHTKMTSLLRRIEWNKLYLFVLYIGFLAPFLLRGLTWAMLYVWTKNYPQVVGTCSGHHGQLISQNCVLTKIRAEQWITVLLLESLDESACRVERLSVQMTMVLLRLC